jgi:hypothetical protein
MMTAQLPGTMVYVLVAEDGGVALGERSVCGAGQRATERREAGGVP